MHVTLPLTSARARADPRIAPRREVEMRFSLIAVVALLFLGGCASGRSVSKSEPAPKSPPASNPTPRASAAPVMQGPVAVLGVPPGQFPPAGTCRVWMPGTAPGQQPEPCSCFSLILDVPAGAWVLYRPSNGESVLQVTKYDATVPNKIVSVDIYDTRNGQHVRTVKL
jgi:hypothetical protein